jgi:hypothetical protein
MDRWANNAKEEYKRRPHLSSVNLESHVENRFDLKRQKDLINLFS